jgi:hypothetical protein
MINCTYQEHDSRRKERQQMKHQQHGIPHPSGGSAYNCPYAKFSRQNARYPSSTIAETEEILEQDLRTLSSSGFFPGWVLLLLWVGEEEN